MFNFFFVFQQPQSLDEFLEISNVIFITIFSLEMIIKIAGEGIRAYLNQWFNIFDGFIVIIRYQQFHLFIFQQLCVVPWGLVRTIPLYIFYSFDH